MFTVYVCGVISMWSSATGDWSLSAGGTGGLMGHSALA